MPEKSQIITAAGDASKLQAIAYGALQELGWTIKYAGDNSLLAYTPKSWNRHETEITVRTGNNQLTVTSKMIHGESFDMMGRTKKDVAQFVAAFETIKTKTTDLKINEWSEKISLLKDVTTTAVDQEIKQAEDIDKVMNLSKGNRYVTYGIIVINVLVFVVMVAGGVSIVTPTGVDIIKWGANFGPFTLSGDWWRLITCVFIHIGIIHLVFNMYALYMVGLYLEPMLGKTRYIVAYLCTGVLASLASLWWHKEPVASAGASGAIFGIYGVFLALLSTNLIPKQVRNSLLQSIGIFVVYNLVYGMKSGVDNSAHIGGLLSGLAIGYLYYLTMKGENTEKKKMPVVAATAIVTVIVTFFYLKTYQESNVTRIKSKSEMELYEYKDADKFNDKYNAIIEMQNRALVPFGDTSLTEEQLAEKLNSISLPEWEKASLAVQELKMFDVPDKAKQKAAVMERYIELRKVQITMIRKLTRDKDEKTNTELNELSDKISKTIDELEQL